MMTILYIIALIMRVVWINVPPLWYDENFTLLLSRMDFHHMLQATMTDVHPPLWYIITWAIYHIAPNAPAWFIRVPACLFSFGSFALFDALTVQLQIQPKVRMTALILMAILPMQLWYAQEGRMYAMLEFFVLLTLVTALDRNYWLMFIGSLGLLYTQNYGPFYLAAIALVLFFRELPWVWMWMMSVMASAGALWLPWTMIIRKQMADISGSYWILDRSFGSVIINIYKVFFAAAVPSSFFFASYAVTFVALIAGCVAIIRSAHHSKLTVLIMAFAPLVIAMLVSWLWQPVILFRPLIGISPFIYLIPCWVLEKETA